MEEPLNGGDLEGYLQEMRSVLYPIDPLHYPSLLTPDRILMVNGYFDAVIKRRYTRELWNHLKKPTLIFSLPAIMVRYCSTITHVLGPYGILIDIWLRISTPST